MIFDYVAVAQYTANKTVSEIFYRGDQRCICLYMYAQLFYYFFIYLTDTSLCVFWLF